MFTILSDGKLFAYARFWAAHPSLPRPLVSTSPSDLLQRSPHPSLRSTANKPRTHCVQKAFSKRVLTLDWSAADRPPIKRCFFYSAGKVACQAFPKNIIKLWGIKAKLENKSWPRSKIFSRFLLPVPVKLSRPPPSGEINFSA